MEHRKRIRTILVNLFVYFAAIAVLFFMPWLIRFFWPLVIGWLISVMANPLAKFMEKRMKIVRKYTSAVIIIVSIGLVILVCYGAGVLIFRLGMLLFQELPGLYALIQSTLTGITEGSHPIFEIIPDSMQQTIAQGIDSIGSSILTWAKEFAAGSVNVVGNIVSNIPSAIVAIVFTVLSAYFFIADKNRMTAWVTKLVSEHTVERYHFIVGELKRAVWGYFKAQFQIMGIMFVILLIGFLVLRVSPAYAVLAAILTAILDFLPFFGTGFVLGPWAVIAFFSEDYFIVFGMGILYLICLVVHQLVQPKLIGDSIGLDPFRTLIFMWIGYRLGGFLGLIIGIPVGMILVNLWEQGVFRNLERTLKELVKEVKSLRSWD